MLTPICGGFLVSVPAFGQEHNLKSVAGVLRWKYKEPLASETFLIIQIKAMIGNQKPNMFVTRTTCNSFLDFHPIKSISSRASLAISDVEYRITGLSDLPMPLLSQIRQVYLEASS